MDTPLSDHSLDKAVQWFCYRELAGTLSGSNPLTPVETLRHGIPWTEACKTSLPPERGYLVWHRNSASACDCALYPLPQRKLPFCGVEIRLSFAFCPSNSLNETGLVLLFRKRNRQGNGMKWKCLILSFRDITERARFFEAEDLEEVQIFREFKSWTIAENKAE